MNNRDIGIMFIDGLYKILEHHEVPEYRKEGVSYIFEVELNPAHKVFEGHFPQEPILPGVVSIRIIKECCELLKGESVSYSSIGQCKFPSAVNPQKHNNIRMTISLIDNVLNAEGCSTEGVFIKLKAKIK